jgi:ubiquinone/menaquinone biosynthesis C-methylase UbiE
MYETSKAVMRRMHDNRFAARYFIGNGIDIGSGNDPLGQYREFFPGMQSCRSWDLPDGDAQLLESIPDASLDFANSSHCLEHMVDPSEAMRNWLRVLKPGGHLVVVVPDEDLYEQGQWPSTWNDDHKWTFTTCKEDSWSPKSINLVDWLPRWREESYLLKIELLDATFRFTATERVDQTMTPVCESAIEFILRKIG